MTDTNEETDLENSTEDGLTKAQIRTKKQEDRAKKKEDRLKLIKSKQWYHPLRILRGIWLFIKYLFIVLFIPYVYSFWKIRDTIKFISRNDPEDLDRDLLSEEDGDEIPFGYIDEKAFLRSLPMFYLIAGTLGAVITLLIFYPTAWEAIKNFFENITWAAFVSILDAIFVQGIWFGIFVPIGNWIQFLFTERIWIPLTFLIVCGIAIILLFVMLTEADFRGKFFRKVKTFFVAIFTFPKKLWYLIKKGISRLTYTERKLKYMNKRFFYRIVIYSAFITLWIIISVIITVIVFELNDIIPDPQDRYLIYPVALIIIGFMNGILLLAFLCWFVGILSGERYITDIDSYNSYYQDMRELRKAKKLERKKKRENAEA